MRTALSEWLPSWRFIALIVVITAGVFIAIRLSPQRIPASIEVWERCSSSNAIVSIQGCSEIIAHNQDASSDLVRAFNHRGLAHSQKGELEAALADFSRGAEISPDYAPVFINRARTNLSLNNISEAIFDYDRALELRPGDIETRFHRGTLLSSLGRWTDAASDFQVIVESNSNSPLGHFGIGHYYFVVQDYPSAKASLQMARDMAQAQGYRDIAEEADRLLADSRMK